MSVPAPHTAAQPHQAQLSPDRDRFIAFLLDNGCGYVELLPGHLALVPLTRSIW